MNWLAVIVAALVQALAPILASRCQRTAEDGALQTDLRQRLQREIRRQWAGKTLLAAALALLLCGCGARTIYVPDGQPVRLRQTIRDARVWVIDKNGQPVAGVMDLPEGWYCLPEPKE